MRQEPALPGVEGDASPLFREGERVRVVDRPVTTKDRKTNSYFRHMANLRGVVANYFGEDEVAVQVDLDSLPKVAFEVQKASTLRMRAKFLDSVGEDQKKSLTKEELEFQPHYVVLLRSADLERIDS